MCLDTMKSKDDFNRDVSQSESGFPNRLLFSVKPQKLQTDLRFNSEDKNLHRDFKVRLKQWFCSNVYAFIFPTK